MRLDNEVEWEKISTNRESTLPPGEYVGVVKEVEDGLTESTSNPVTTVKVEVTEGDHIGREIWDRIYPKTKKGGVNKVAMGQIKEWATATVGADRLASKDFDTKEFEGHTVRVVTKQESYDKENTDGTKSTGLRTAIAKVLKY